MARAQAAVRGGATVVQLRLKQADARTLVDVGRGLVAGLPVPVIVNDRADVALACGAAGVHVGADDVPVASLRHIVPPGFIIGASVRADTTGADYVGIGPIFPTISKSNAPAAIGVDGFRKFLTTIPAVAIGGITTANVTGLRETGAAGIAVISGIFGTTDPEAAARALRDAWQR
ncbi:MAG TPA: thiamine phosphate synthase [Gemmatimonadaceae bacterium]|nr:thiamine phosphate synthase [Gemmatimonadaceae bacterium]